MLGSGHAFTTAARVIAARGDGCELGHLDAVHVGGGRRPNGGLPMI